MIMAGSMDTGATPQTAPSEQSEGFRAAIAAHEMGHATDFEGRQRPRARKAMERGLWLGGKGASLLAQARGRPLMAAAGQLLAGAPELYSEGTATYRGLKALKESGKYTPEEQKRMRKTLLWAGGTYLNPRLVDAGFAAGAAAIQKHRPDITEALMERAMQDPTEAIGLALGTAGAKKLTKAMTGLVPFGMYSGHAKKSPSMAIPEAEKLREQMGVRAQIYPMKADALGENAAYIPLGQKLPERKIPEFAKDLEEIMHRPFSEEDARTMLREGGILLPTRGKLEKTGEEKKPSLGKRIAKNIGLGALTLGTAGGIVAASDPKATRDAYRFLKARALKKLGGATPAGHETLSRAHWPTLAKVLVK